MNVLTLRRFHEYCDKYPETAGLLTAWHQSASRADWKTPADVKAANPTADILPDDRVCFNINGNRYRLIVRVDYTYKSVMLKWFGPHSEYVRINAEEIGKPDGA